MKLTAYEFTLPAEGAACSFAVLDPNNLYGGTKQCGKPARVVSKQRPNQKPEALCEHHLGAVWSSSSLVRDQLLTELLIRALKQERQP